MVLVLIRPARAGDATALAPLFTEWGHEQPASVISALLVEWEQTPRADVLVAEVTEGLAGMVAVSATPNLGRPGRTAQLRGLVVAATHRRRGVGAALVRAAEDHAREWHCDRLELVSSRSRGAAHAFYPALGYEEQSGRQARYVRRL